MAGTTTTYKVELVYDLKGNAAKGLKEMERQAKATSGGFGGLKAAVGLAFGGAALGLGKKFFYDFNTQVQKLKIGLATVTSMNFHRPFKEGALAAEKMFENFQKMAQQSPATTKDFVEMANMISSSVLQSGKGLKDLEQITAGAITASAALGAAPDILARDIRSMLTGQITSKDFYAMQLLSGIGVTDFDKYNKDVRSGKTSGADMTQKALSTDTLKDAAAAFGESTEGVMSTFQDNLEITLGKVGLPLMKAMTDEVKSWNNWISANPEKVAAFIDKIGSGLKTAFSIIKDIVISLWPLIKDVFGVVQSVLGFVAEHREILVGAIKALLVYKGVTMGVGMARAGAGALGGMFSSLKNFGGAIGGLVTGSQGAGSGLMALGSSLFGPTGAIGGIMALGTAAWGVSKLLFGQTEAEKKQAAVDAAKVTSAKEWTEKNEELNTLLQERLDKGIKADDTAGYGGRLNEKIGNLSAGLTSYQDELLRQGEKAGRITAERDGDSIKWSFAQGRGTSGAADASTMKADIALDQALNEMFAQKYEQKWAEVKAEYGATGSGAPAVGVNKYTGRFEYDTIEEANLAFAWSQASTDIQNWAGYDQYGRGKQGASAWFKESLLAPTEEPVNPMDLYNMTPPKAPDVNVTINKIEVASDDPDRFVMGAVKAFEEVVRNPTQAAGTIRGGF